LWWFAGIGFKFREQIAFMFSLTPLMGIPAITRLTKRRYSNEKFRARRASRRSEDTVSVG
jgi:hypothetical protein